MLLNVYHFIEIMIEVDGERQRAIIIIRIHFVCDYFYFSIF